MGVQASAPQCECRVPVLGAPPQTDKPVSCAECGPEDLRVFANVATTDETKLAFSPAAAIGTSVLRDQLKRETSSCVINWSDRE